MQGPAVDIRPLHSADVSPASEIILFVHRCAACGAKQGVDSTKIKPAIEIIVTKWKLCGENLATG
jgi:hypothetical protein